MDPFSFVINADLKENEDVYPNLKQFSNINALQDEQLYEFFCKKVIKNFENIFEIYVYSDIAKNPPQIEGHLNYHHEKINLKEKLEQIPTKNRRYYEFYQEIESIVSSVRDRHLNVPGIMTPVDVKLYQYEANLPFDFIIKEFNSEYRLFIKKNDYYIQINDKKIKNIIDKYSYHVSLKIPIKRINNEDPFYYIQNWSKFRSLKSIHAQFSLRIKEVSHFFLYNHPLNYSEMSLNEYEFEDGTILRIPYYIKVPVQNKLKYDNYVLNVITSSGPLNEIPNLNAIYNNFLNLKEGKKSFSQIFNTKIDWDINLSYTEGNKNIKCRVDNINEVNVIYQNFLPLIVFMKFKEKCFNMQSYFLQMNIQLLLQNLKMEDALLICFLFCFKFYNQEQILKITFLSGLLTVQKSF